MSEDALGDYNDIMAWLDKNYKKEYDELKQQLALLEEDMVQGVANNFHMKTKDVRHVVYEWEDYSDFN